MIENSVQEGRNLPSGAPVRIGRRVLEYNFPMLKEIFLGLFKLALVGLGLGVVAALIAWTNGMDVKEWFIAGILPAAILIVVALGVILFFGILWLLLEATIGSWFR